MTTPAASKTPTLGIAVGGIYENDYHGFLGGTSFESQQGLMPLQIDGNGYLLVNVAEPSTFVTADAVLDSTVKTAGTAKATTGIQVGGNDGTDFRALLTSTTGQLHTIIDSATLGTVVVTEASLDDAISTAGHTIPANIVQVGGTDGTNLRALLTDSTGALQVDVLSGGGSNPSVGDLGLTAPTEATLVGGQDGSGNLAGLQIYGGNLQVQDSELDGTVETDSLSGESYLAVGGFAAGPIPMALQFDDSGNLLVTGDGGGGASAVEGSSDGGTTLYPLLTDKSGRLQVVIADWPDFAIELPDPTDYYDVDLNGAVATPRFPSPPNTVQIAGKVTQGTSPWSTRDLATGIVGSGVAPADAIQIGGTDGSTLRALKTDASGNLYTLNQVNPILAATAETITTTVTSITKVAAFPSQCTAVTLTNSLGSGAWSTNVCVRVRNTTSGIKLAWQNAGILQSACFTTLFFNVPAAFNDSIVIDIIASASIGSGGVSVAASMLPNPAPVSLRPDGLSLPLGSQAVDLNISANSGTILAAPAAGFRIQIGTMFLGAAAATALQLLATINGASTALFETFAAVSGSQVFPSGVIADPATAVTWSNGSSQTAHGGFTYDIIPAT